MEKVIRTDPNDSNSATTAPGGPHPTRRGRLHPLLGPSPPSGALRGLSGTTCERPWKEGSTRAKPRRRPSAPRWRPPRPRRPRGRWSAAARAPICSMGATRAAAARERWVGRARVQPGGEAETGHHAGGAAGRVRRAGSMCSMAAVRAPPPTEDVNWPRARPSTPLLAQVGHVRTAAAVRRSEVEVCGGCCGRRTVPPGTAPSLCCEAIAPEPFDFSATAVATVSAEKVADKPLEPWEKELIAKLEDQAPAAKK